MHPVLSPSYVEMGHRNLPHITPKEHALGKAKKILTSVKHTLPAPNKELPALAQYKLGNSRARRATTEKVPSLVPTN